jgi:putative DNA methylase
MNLFSTPPFPERLSPKDGLLDALTEAEIEWIQEELKSRTAVRPLFSLHKYFARRSGRVFNWAIGQVEQLLGRDELCILDPMAGGGSILWEAFSRGHRVHGQDLNPLASLIQAAMFWPGSEVALQRALDDITTQARQALASLWQTTLADGQTADIIYSHFVRQVACPHCEADVLLYHNTLLNRGRTRGKPCNAANPADHWCPRCGGLNLDHETESVTCQHCHTGYDAEVGTVHKRACTCPSCRETFSPREGLAQGSQLKLVAIEYLDPATGRKLFKQPDQEDQQRFHQPAAVATLPDLGDIPPGTETRRLHNNGFHTWQTLFTPRQLVGYAKLFALAQAQPDPFCRLVATLAISSTLEYNCSLVAYNFKYRKSHHLFTHHAFPVAIQGVEGHLPGVGNKGAGTPVNRFRDVLKMMGQRKWGEKGTQRRKLRFSLAPIENPTSQIPLPVRVINGDSRHIDAPDGAFDAIVTDPPYHDNIQYGELTEFFLAWLRHYASEFLPHMPNAAQVQQAEATANFSRGEAQGDQFQVVLTAIFREGYRVTKPDGLLLFSFHDTDERGWQELAEALRASGWYLWEFTSTQSEFIHNLHLKDYKDPLDRDLLILCGKTPVPVSLSVADDHPELQKWGSLLMEQVNYNRTPS